jgi:pilus assembly protein Flp/PilA
MFLRHRRSCVVRRLRSPPATRGATASIKEEEMAYLVSLVSSLRRDDAQDLLEYALLVALIALVAIAAVTAAGVKVNAVFNAIATAIPS